MSTQKNIFIAFILNFTFSVFELVGGIITGSIAILSDAVHDLGDAVSIGIAFLLEKKSKKQPDDEYTYGYARYSVLGSLITTLILFVGSALVIYNAICRIIEPQAIHYNGMIAFAIIGVCVNFCAAFFTRGGTSLNQRAVNLHMLEDVFGWAVVLLGAIVMKLTDVAIIDPVLSILVAAFIIFNAVKNLKEIICILLEKIPNTIIVEEIKKQINNIEGVLDVHHIHVWSLDGQNNYATMHIVTNEEPRAAKTAVREKLKEYNIAHVTLELEGEGEGCDETRCIVKHNVEQHHHHHHHSSK